MWGQTAPSFQSSTKSIMSQIIISALDYDRIKRSIENAKNRKSINNQEAENLLKELSTAKVVKPKEIPNDVITMNSVVKITFVKNNSHIELKLVYPDQANMEKYHLSIFSPIATALLGYKVGDVIDWIVPSGPTSIRIDEITYQPEAAGEFDL
jgi:regulator of nucleoside diphosphate kinase